ncbi:bifunctional 4-hydroxy-2-oxoglutarate aldolase/2-dehydro-3-deoxy-phosphogluconate aldolase [Gordonia sp. NPDC003424]
MSVPTERTQLPLPAKAVVAVLRAPTAEHFVSASRVLRDAGITCFEYTLTTQGVWQALDHARAELPDATIGIGSVRTCDDITRAAATGVPFAVSQVFLPELVAEAAAREIPYVPGTLTPTEVLGAWNTGVPAVKVSPIGPLGGVDYLAELRAPMPDVVIMPTGGVTLDAAHAYLDAGAVAVGVSGALFGTSLVDGDLAPLAQRAQLLMSEQN